VCAQTLHCLPITMCPIVGAKRGKNYSSFLYAHKWDLSSQIYTKKYLFSLMEITQGSQRDQVNILRKSSNLKYQLLQHNEVSRGLSQGIPWTSQFKRRTALQESSASTGQIPAIPCNYCARNDEAELAMCHRIT